MLGVQERLPRVREGWSPGRAASSPGVSILQGQHAREVFTQTGRGGCPDPHLRRPSEPSQQRPSQQPWGSSESPSPAPSDPAWEAGQVRPAGGLLGEGQASHRDRAWPSSTEGPLRAGKWRVCFRRTDLGLRMRRAPRQRRRPHTAALCPRPQLTAPTRSFEDFSSLERGWE